MKEPAAETKEKEEENPNLQWWHFEGNNGEPYPFFIIMNKVTQDYYQETIDKTKLGIPNSPLFFKEGI